MASRLTEGFVVPVAMEYPFWNERTPEALIRFGEPLDLAKNRGLDSREWTAKIEKVLAQCQDVLAVEAMQRDPAAFDALVSGQVGVGGLYDCWRRFMSRLRGKKFDAAHGTSECTPLAPQEEISSCGARGVHSDVKAS